MKRFLILTVLLIGAGSYWLLMPSPEVDAAACVKCLPGGQTGPAWGFGSTCAAATSDAINQASNQIPGGCATCSEIVVGLDPCNTSCSNPAVCYDPYGEWRVDVKIRYRCLEDICL